jgi:hypothetical protein
LFGKVFKPHVLAAVTLNIHSGNLKAGISLLEALEKDTRAGQVPHGRHTVSKVIRTLYIDSLCPSFPFFESSEFGQGKWSRAISVSSAEKKIRLLLEPALKSLHSLDTLR